MIETIIVLSLVGLALLGIARSLWKQGTNKKGGCQGCSEGCSPHSSCSSPESSNLNAGQKQQQQERETENE
jgi:hypothetical protein